MSPEEALNYASIVAVDEDERTASINASWRKSPVSAAQVKKARSIGCPILPEDTQGTLSDRMTWRSACVALRDPGMRMAS
jgi:hypothetical protein